MHTAHMLRIIHGFYQPWIVVLSIDDTAVHSILPFISWNKFHQ